MKKINTILAATALSVVSAASQAALIPISGTLTAWSAAPAVQTYPVGLPTYTGTIDDTTGALNLTFSTIVANVSVFGIYNATITTAAGSTYTTTNGGNGAVVTKGGPVGVCAGSPLICGSQPTSTLFLAGNVTPTSFSTTQTTAGGVSNQTWSIEAAAVPVPAAAWLFGSALVGLAGVGRKRKA